MRLLLTPEIIILFIEDLLLLGFNTIALIIAFRIQKDFNLSSTSHKQYTLEKQSYLASYIIKFSLSLKIMSALFFIYTLDKLSAVIPGAMCAVGVTTASSYGIVLLIFKMISLYVYGFWILMHNMDVKRDDYPYTKTKFKYYLVIYVFFMIEFILQYLYFFDIDPEKIVSCCGTVFNATNTSFVGQLSQISPAYALPLFFMMYVAIVLVAFKRMNRLFGILNVGFLVFAIVTLINTFGTYIYELPTHHCPFCLLQSDYYYIGYVLYAFLFSGTFFGIANSFLKTILNVDAGYYRISLLLNSIYLMLVLFYPIRYFIVNGVWL